MAFIENDRAPFAHRTRFGGSALLAWRERVAREGSTIEPENDWQIAELLADVLHTARALGVDPDKAMERAKSHFERECRYV